MIKGGVCILDEANRMAEKSWASLAPLLDQRRYIESIIAGIKIQAHSDFRICVTMNDDNSTFEVPEYIHSRLQPQIFIEFPERGEEMEILKFNIPFAKKDLIEYIVDFLQRAHKEEKIYTVRDGINICRYYMKMEQYQIERKDTNTTKFNSDKKPILKKGLENELIEQSIRQILGKDAVDFLNNLNTPGKKSSKDRFKAFFDPFEKISPKNQNHLDKDEFDNDWDEDFEDSDEDLFEDDPDHNQNFDSETEDFPDDDILDPLDTDDVLHIVEEIDDPKTKGSKNKSNEKISNKFNEKKKDKTDFTNPGTDIEIEHEKDLDKPDDEDMENISFRDIIDKLREKQKPDKTTTSKNKKK
jgi:hypothetical protein